MQLVQESDVLEIKRVYGYTVLLPSDAVLQATFDGIEKEINREKLRLKSMKSWSLLWERQDVKNIRRRIRKLQEIQMEIDMIRKMY